VSAEDDAILAAFLARHGIVEQRDGGEIPPADAKLPKPKSGAKSANQAKPEDKK
jgi:hypothetical protein